MPLGEKSRERQLIDGLHFLAQTCQRSAADKAQHFGVAPLSLGPQRAKLSAHHPMCRFKSGQCHCRTFETDSKS